MLRERLSLSIWNLSCLENEKKKVAVVALLMSIIFASHFTVLRLFLSLNKHFEIWNDVNDVN